MATEPLQLADGASEIPEMPSPALVPTIYTAEQVWKADDFPDKSYVGTLMSMLRECSRADEAARRFHVLETWEARHMDRQYQYLEDANGGWRIAGTESGRKNSLAAADDAGLYPTNVYSAQGDIATGVLMRGEIEVDFAPKSSKDPSSVAAAETASKYAKIWAKRNRGLQDQVVQAAWTDCRALIWTRTVADPKFGEDADGSPAKREISSAYGILESKLPMMVDRLADCGYAQLFEEVDYAIARAAYPWMGAKIKPSWGTSGEQEFERIARINTRIGIVGRYITGTSGIRETTMGYRWLRPGMFFDDSFTADKRAFLLENFPDGIFVISAGPDFVCAWNESLDDHLALAMFTRGYGQNRRALGTGDIPIQKRINIWADLWDKYVRTSIPITLLEDKAFDADAVSQLEASPGRFMSVALDEGQGMGDVVGQTPTPQPLPQMMAMFQVYIGPLIQSIDGATPALFGGAEGEDNTVGATQIRLNQALERYGAVWQRICGAFRESARQAAVLCGENQTSPVSDTAPGDGDITVDPALLRGDFEVAETRAEIPESGAQREAKIMQVLDMAKASPAVMSMLSTSANAREIVRGLHLDDVITVDEADAEDGALENLEILLESEPLVNPAWQQMSEELAAMTAQHEAMGAEAVQNLQNGVPPQPEQVQAGMEMADQVQSLESQLQKTPQFLPSVAVVDNGSQDNSTIAKTIFDWMQKPEGRKVRRAGENAQPGTPEWAKWTNVFLYWKGNNDLAQKNANAKIPPPKVSITGKLTPEQQAQILLMDAGIQTDLQNIGAPHEIEQESRVYGPASEVVTKTKRRL